MKPLRYKVPQEGHFFVYHSISGHILFRGNYNKGNVVELPFNSFMICGDEAIGPGTSNPRKYSYGLPVNFKDSAVGGNV